MRPGHTVIGTVRDPDADSSKALYDLPRAKGSILILARLESTSESDGKKMITLLESKYNIRHLDVVIANAAISNNYAFVHEAEPADMLEHYAVNVVGVVLLFQATRSLLLKSINDPKFIALGSTAGSIGDLEALPVPNGNYAPSKAALHWIVKKIHAENPSLIAFPVHPGWVQTDMGNTAAHILGLAHAEITIEESVNGIVELVNFVSSTFLEA